MSPQDLKTRTSADWLAYLLGRTPSRQAVTTATPAPRTPFGGNPEMTKEAHYLYDPATQTYTWTQPKPQEGAAPAQRESQGSDSGLAALGGGGSDWDRMSGAEKAAYYASNPTMAGITQALQKGFGFTGMGMLQNYLDPNFVAEQRGIAAGITPDGGGSKGPLSGAAWGETSPAMDPNALAEQYGMYGGAYESMQPSAPPSGAADYFGGGYSGEGFSGLGAGAEGPSNTVSASDLDSGHESDQGQGFFARGGIAALAAGGPVQEMSQQNQQLTLLANGGQQFAAGGISNLGDYSDGGRLLKGPGDGVSDSIPATIADKRPARLADGEFVVPARIVSELGNGSTEAGARKLYAMMDRIQKARNKTVGKNKVAVNSRADKHLPA